MNTASQRRIFEDIISERFRQDDTHGGATHDDTHNKQDWIGFIYLWARKASYANDSADYRRRMVQVAALAVAAIESFDRQMAQEAEMRAMLTSTEKVTMRPPDDEASRYYCPHCSYFANYGMLQGNGPYRCPECGTGLKFNDPLKERDR